jgi:hypothetical protein
MLELAEEKVLVYPSPYNSCFRRLNMDERIGVIRCADSNFDYMARSVRFLNYLLGQEAASEDASHMHMLIRRLFAKAAKEGIPAFGLPCWTLQHASRCDSFLLEKWHDRLTAEEA